MSDSNARIREKRALLEELLKADYAFLHVTTRSPGISLPLNVLQDPIVTLKVSFHFDRKMEIADTGVEAELSFGSKVFNCKIPWTAIWGMSSADGKRLVWPDEIPSEVSAAVEKAAPVPSKKSSLSNVPKAATPQHAPAPKPAPAASGDSTRENQAPASAPVAPEAKTPRAKPVLRRVK